MRPAEGWLASAVAGPRALGRIVLMASGHECYHCKEWLDDGVEHDCWTTTEQALTKDLSEDLRDAWARVRETAADLGEQRIYASHHSIMFARKTCYFFVRPKRTKLELCIFLGRPLKSPLVRKSVATSRTKVAHLVDIVHRDQVEAPLTDWMAEAYGLQDVTPTAASPAGTKKPARKKPPAKRRLTAGRSRTRASRLSR
jgi:hypothetical protein